MGSRRSDGKNLLRNMSFETRSSRWESSRAVEGGWGWGCRCARETTTYQGAEDEGSRGAGGVMVGRAEKVTAGGTVAKGLVAARAVGQRGRVAAGAVETVEASKARSCGTGGVTEVATLAKAGCRAAGATEVARLAEAGGCRAVGATEVARGAGARVCCAAGATRVAELGGSGCWAESPERKEAWSRSAAARAAAVERVWASREARRDSRPRTRVVSSRAFVMS